MISCIGYGRQCKSYIAAIKQVAGLELAAVCDVRPSVAKEAVQESWMPRYYTDYKELFAKEKLDAIGLRPPFVWDGQTRTRNLLSKTDSD